MAPSLESTHIPHIPAPLSSALPASRPAASPPLSTSQAFYRPPTPPTSEPFAEPAPHVHHTPTFHISHSSTAVMYQVNNGSVQSTTHYHDPTDPTPTPAPAAPVPVAHAPAAEELSRPRLVILANVGRTGDSPHGSSALSPDAGSPEPYYTPGEGSPTEAA